MATSFLSKVGHNSHNFLGNFETHHFLSNPAFWATVEKIVQLYIPISGHTESTNLSLIFPLRTSCSARDPFSVCHPLTLSSLRNRSWQFVWGVVKRLTFQNLLSCEHCTVILVIKKWNEFRPKNVFTKWPKNWVCEIFVENVAKFGAVHLVALLERERGNLFGDDKEKFN